MKRFADIERLRKRSLPGIGFSERLPAAMILGRIAAGSRYESTTFLSGVWSSVA